MSLPFTLDDEPIVLVVPKSASIPPGNITEAEWLQLKDRVTVVEGMELGDLGDVDTEGDAQTVLIKLEDGSFAFGSMAGSLGRVTQTWGSTPPPGFDDVEQIGLDPGLSIREGWAPGAAIIAPVFGTTATTVARGDHGHIQPLPTRITTAPSGYMSGGSRSLGSTSVTLTNNINYVVEAELYGQLRGADPGAAYYTLTINIGGNTYTSPGGSDGLWCVQGVPDKINWEHARRMTGTGASVPVSATIAWHSGSGLTVDRTWLRVRIRPDR